uniref:Uncharacterized protein n=1 Tax=Anguilla anguilla TaxID=7936 RepID=A0A0E9RMU3_ANGAN
MCSRQTHKLDYQEAGF